MGTVPVKAPRWKREGSRFSIPSYKGVLAILTLAGFVAMWGIALVQGVAGLVKKGLSEDFGPFQVVGLGSVLVLEVVVAVLLAWHLVGREVVEVTGGEMVLSFEVLGLRKEKRYSVSSITGMRAVPVPAWGLRPGSRPHIGTNSGAIAFDYGARTVRFGSSLDEAEARLLVKDLVQHTPSLGREI